MDSLVMTPIAVTLRFASPWWLAAGLAAAAPPLAAWGARRRGRHVPAAGVALQMLAVLLAAAALARPALPIGRRAAKGYMLLGDVSASTRGQELDPASFEADVPIEAYDLAGGVARRSDGAGHGAATRRAAAGSAVRRDRTVVSPALRLAAAQRRRLAGVIIRTDGQFQDASAWPAAADALAAAGLDVLILPLSSPPPDARVVELTAGRTGDGKVALRVSVMANAPLRRRLVVRRRGAATPLLSRELDLLADTAATFRLTDADPADRAAVYEAALAPADAFRENDAASAVSLPRWPGLALIAPPGVDLSRLGAALPGRLERVEPGEAPADAAGWLDFAAVILIDSRGTLLDRPRRAAVGQFVRSGGGLVLAGAAPHGEPGDREDPLSRVSALLANPYERRPMRVVVVLDASGSMTERVAEEDAAPRRVRFDAAVEAVLSLKRHLTPRDSLSVITFSDSARRVYDSASAAPDFAAVREALAEVRPAGATDVMKGIELAAAEPKPKKQTALVILLSDLIPTKPFDPAKAAAMIRDKELRLAIVGTVPPGASPPETAGLKRLAAAVGAPLVTRDRLTGLAEVFAGFVRRARGEAVRRGRWPMPSQVSLFGREIRSMPPLGAYILSRAPQGTRVMLRVGDDPLLARRQVGLGRSVCLAAPLDDAGNDAARRSRALADLIAAAVGWARRNAEDPRFQAGVQPGARGLALTVTARDAGRPVNDLDLTARVLAAGEAAVVSAPLVQTGPGRYEAELAAPDEPASLVVADADGRIVYRTALGAAAAPEFARIGANWDNLRTLAERTGGRIVSQADLPRLTRAWELGRYTPVWPALLAAALLVMLVEWGLVRVWRRGG